MQIAYLPLTLLVSAAVFSGATVVSIIIAIRAKREHDNTIFSMVRESEQLTIRRSLAAMLFFLVLSASTIGGWTATQQNPANVLIARQDVEPTETMAVVAVIATAQNTPAPQLLMPTETAPIPATAQIVGSTSILTPTPAEPTATPIPVEPAGNPAEPTATPIPEEPTATPVPVEPTATAAPAEPTATPIPAEPTESPAPVEIAAVTQVTTETVDAAEPTPVPMGDEAAPTDAAEPVAAVSANSPASTAKNQESNIGPISFSAEVTDDRQAVNPQNTFDGKTQKVYAVFSYKDMKNGTPFSTVWYLKGKEILRDEFTWNWGPKDTSYTFIRVVGAGTYKVEIRVNNELQAEGTFDVTP